MKTFFCLFLCLGLGFTLARGATESAAPALQVSVQGSGPPLVLIPGYLCSGDAWDDAVLRYAPRFRCHKVTLPGFAGASPLPRGPYLTGYRDSLIAYLRDQAGGPAVLVGHSLGGLVALSVALEAPELVESVVTVDGVPFFPALLNPAAKPASDATATARYAQMLSRLTPEQRGRQKEMAMSRMISDPARRARAVAWAVRGDPTTEAGVMAEMMETDLRRELARLRRPLLVLGAFQPSAPEGGMGGEETERRYRAQFSATKCELHMIEARHFLMYEEPAWLWEKMDAFLPHAHARR